jgi:hypothetical protein
MDAQKEHVRPVLASDPPGSVREPIPRSDAVRRLWHRLHLAHGTRPIAGAILIGGVVIAIALEVGVGELAFGGLALWKTLDGGFTESRLERGLYGTVGWYLIGTNAKLCLGLMFSDSSRAWYAENGSFGLTNDMIRAAEEVLHTRLQSVAFLMLLATLGALAAAFGLWRLSSRSR